MGLAITGALAVMCMAKVYGVTFLGAPRTKEAENRHLCTAPDERKRSGTGDLLRNWRVLLRRGCCRCCLLLYLCRWSLLTPPFLNR